MEDLLAEFEDGLRKYIVDHYQEIHFTQKQYGIEKVDEDSYDVDVSISGLGIQNFQFIVTPGEFMIRGKLIDTNEKFPYDLLARLVDGLITKCLAESTTKPPSTELVIPTVQLPAVSS
jgi:hypothetical protein